jgi:hypothetical protein
LNSRLVYWKNRFIYIGERVTLLNSVVNFFPIHFLSFYKMPKKFIGKLLRFKEISVGKR